MARNLKALKFKEGDFAWNFEKAKMVLTSYTRNQNKKKVDAYKELADLCFVTEDAVKNWFVGKNGPGDAEMVRTVAEYLNVDIFSLLTEVKTVQEEVNEMEKRQQYLEEMMDMMINLPEETGYVANAVKFIGLLNELAAASVKGFLPFSEYVKMSKKGDYEGVYGRIVYDDRKGPGYGRIVADMCVDECHEDIVSYYGDILNSYDENGNYKVYLRDENPDDIFVEVLGDDLSIVIENGRWYCC